MGRQTTSSIALLSLALFAISAGQQQGQGGFGGIGGPAQRRNYTDAVQQIEQRIGIYLKVEEVRSILTPGEFIEWKMPLKAGQVVIADARSDAFDPALEVVDGKGKALAQNDDRYPGDQRPLLLWRCDKDGDYSLHARCFRDKSGGLVFVRMKTYDTVDLTSGQMVEKEINARAPFLLRVPMKAGQLKEVVADDGANGDYLGIQFGAVIFPNGLPERSPSLSEPLSPAIRALVAPVDGDYYLYYTPNWSDRDRRKVHVGTREIVPVKLAGSGNANALTNTPALFELTVKAGDLLRASTPELAIYNSFVVSEAPDFSKFDVKKSETNPFYPKQEDETAPADPAFVLLPARARDGRTLVFQARRDAKLWLATNGAGPLNQQFTLEVKPAAVALDEQPTNVGKLRIGDTDYWAFDAKAGDVVSLRSSATDFSQVVVLRDPDLVELVHYDMPLDQPEFGRRMVAQKPGRYVIAVSCLGDGGGGDYTLSRQVLPAKVFDMTNPAKGEIAEGQVQIWRFTVTPDKPLLIHWNSSEWNYNVAIYDDKGQPADFQRQVLDDNNQLGILKVSKPTTYIIVLSGTGGRGSYSIDLNPIPGYASK